MTRYAVLSIKAVRAMEELGQRPRGYASDVLSRAVRSDERLGLVWLPRDTMNQLKQKYRPGQASSQTVKRRPPINPLRSSGIGDRLSQAILLRWGALPCQACRKEISMLNAMMPERALAEAPALAARMAQRWEQLPKWWQRIAVRLALKTPLTKSMVEAMLLSMIRDAIQAKSK